MPELRSARIRRQALANLIQIGVHLAVVQYRQLLLRLSRRLLSDLNVITGREEIESRLDVGLRVRDARAEDQRQKERNRRARAASWSFHEHLLNSQRKCIADAG